MKRLLSILMCVALLLPVTATAKVTSKPSRPAMLQSLKINRTGVLLTVGKTFQLKATAVPASRNKDIRWKSDKPNIVAVTKKGKVTAKKPGRVYVSAYIGSKKVKCLFVIKKSLKESITVDGVKFTYQTAFSKGNMIADLSGFKMTSMGPQLWFGWRDTRRAFRYYFKGTAFPKSKDKWAVAPLAYKEYDKNGNVTQSGPVNLSFGRFNYNPHDSVFDARQNDDMIQIHKDTVRVYYYFDTIRTRLPDGPNDGW